MRKLARRWRGVALGLLVVVLCFFAFTRGSARSHPRARWALPEPSARFSRWEEVFARGGRVELRSLDTGAVHVSRRSMLRREHPAVASFRDERPLRVYAHLLRHPTRGDVLVDTGLDRSFARDRYGNLQRPSRWLLALLMDAPYTQRPGEEVEAQLARLGARPRVAFFTHLHMDHTAGLPSLPRDLALVTGPGEALDEVQRFGFGHLAEGAVLHELDFRGAPELAPLGPALDLLGDGSVWAISTPGHSPGHLSFVVNSTEGPVLLTGDASHFAWGFEHGVGPYTPSAGTREEAQRSLERLRAFARAYPQARVFFGHEAPAR